MNKNPLDYLDSIPVIGFSDLKSQFNNLDDTTEEGRYLLNSIGADTENRFYFYKKDGNSNNISVLEELANNYNKSVKEGEEILDLKKHIVLASSSLNYRRIFGQINPTVILSLPKTKYTELRLLCGSNLEQIRKEVINDQLQTERINDFLEEYKIIKMFPPKVGKESVFNGFTIKTKNGDDGPYNAFLDRYGREIAKLVQVQQPEGNLRYTYAISFILPSDKSDADHIVETIKKVTGDGDEVGIGEMKSFSEYLNLHILSDPVLFNNFATDLEKEMDEKETEEEGLSSNSSSPFDAENEILAQNGPFPIEADESEPEKPTTFVKIIKRPSSLKNGAVQLIFNFYEEPNNKNNHGTEQNNNAQDSSVQQGNASVNAEEASDNIGSVRGQGSATDDMPSTNGVDNGSVSRDNTDADALGTGNSDDGNRVGSNPMGEGGLRNKGGESGEHDSASGVSGSDHEGDVRGDSGTQTASIEDVQPGMVPEGIDTLQPDGRPLAGGNVLQPSEDSSVRNGDRTREDVVEETNPVIYNENAYIDSEHDIDVPVAGTAAAFEANVKAINTLTDIIIRGDLQPTSEEQETLKKFTGFGGLTTKYILENSTCLDYHSKNKASEILNELGDKGSDVNSEKGDRNIDRAVYRLCEALSTTHKNGSLNVYGISDNTTIDGKKFDWVNPRQNTVNIVNSLVFSGSFDYWTPTIISNLQKTIINDLGINGGRYKEPTAGIGNMTHALDRDTISKFQITSVEMNLITGLINKCLNPSSNVIISKLEDSMTAPSNLTVSNVPFVENVAVSDKNFYNNPDKRYRKAGNSITSYFPVKMIEETAPGGIVVCLNTTSFLDNYRHTDARDLISEKANLIGAVRFPSGMFSDTKVNTDLLIFQKKGEGVLNLTNNNNFVNTTDQTLDCGDGTTKEYRLNEYFERYPENIIGSPTNAFRGIQYTSELTHDEIAAKAEYIIKSVIRDYKEQTKIQKIDIDSSKQEDKPVQLSLFDETIGVKNIFSDYVELKNTYNKLIKADMVGLPEADTLRSELNRTYDAFVQTYGHINDPKNVKKLESDKPDFLKIAALENVKKSINLSTNKVSLSYSKSDIFDHCTIRPAQKDTNTNDPKELVYFLFATEGKIDPQKLENKLGADWLDKCSDTIFLNPETSKYELSNIYLSGDIHDKIEKAKAAALYDDRYVKNIEALEKTLPPRIGIDAITVNMGTDLASVDIYQYFVKTQCMNLRGWGEIERTKCAINYDDANHSWSVSFTQREFDMLKSYDVRRPDCNSRRIFEAALNDQYVTVNDYVEENGKRKAVENVSLSLMANAKVKEIRTQFEEWIHTKASKEMMDKIEDNFNIRFNQFVSPNWDSMQVNVDGSTMVPREHQKNVIARGLTNDDLLMHHAVGAGKTLAMGMTMMERIRLGIAHKCCLLTMKANAAQIAEEIQKAYPNAKILFPSEKDFEKDNRNIFLNKIKHSDADIVIMTHDQFNNIKHEEKYREKFVQWMRDAIIEMKEKADDGNGLTPAQTKKIKQFEENIRTRIDNENEKLQKDDISWSELGFDNLAVDEAHVFKNLFFTTNHDNVKGISVNSDSKRAMHLFMAVRDIQDKNNGDKGIIFATGTPISNSLAELYNLEVYLVPNLLRKQGITCFDKWADVFAQRQKDWEPDELGRPKEVERFRSFVNLQALLTTYKGFADVISEKELIEKKLVPNKPRAQYQQVIVPYDEKTDGLIFDELRSIMDSGKSELFNENLTGPQLSAKNLKVLSYGSKAAITPKLLGLKDERLNSIHTKVEYVSKNVARIYNETTAVKGTQLIFSDLIQTGATAEVDYNLYKDIKDTLVEKYGIPANEIVSILDVKEKEKKDFFDKVNDGQVRIVIGSTSKLGTGVNVQKRACAAHMIDVNWTPSGMIQKTGRVARQGNEFAQQFLNNQVPVFLYVKEKSTDAKKYGLVFAKQRMIEQITDKNFKGNRFDEGKSDTELESDIFQEMLASATGDNTSMVKNKLTKQYDLLKSKKKGFEAVRYNISRNIQLNEDKKQKLQNTLRQINDLIVSLDRAKFIKDPKEDKYPFLVKYDGKEYSNAKELGKAIVFDIAAAMENKRFLNKKLEGYGMTAMLQGSKKEFSILLTRDMFSDINEETRNTLGLSKPINVNTMANEMESIGRILNNLCLGIKTSKTSYEKLIADIDFNQKNLFASLEKAKVFPEQAEMDRMNEDLKILERALKKNDWNNEVSSTLINIKNSLSDSSQLLLVRDGGIIKLYLGEKMDDIGQMTNIEKKKDYISSHDVLYIKNEADLDKVVQYCKSKYNISYIHNLREIMQLDKYDYNRVKISTNIRTKDDVKTISDLVAKGAKEDKIKSEQDDSRLSVLRNQETQTKEEETDEVKQMNKNIITWKELGFPDPKDKNPDISHIHDLSNMSLTPIQAHKNYVIDDSVLTGMMGEPDIKEILTNTNNKMEQELSKNDLNKKLEDLQKQVSAQIIGMDFMEAKLETREATLFDSDVMEGALKEVSELDKEIRKDIEQYTPYATKDEEINSYVKSITKLKDKLGDVSNTINLYLNNSNIQVSTEKNNDMAKKKTEPQEQTPKETAGKKETTKKEGEKQPAEPKKKEVKESKKEEKKTSTEVKMSIPEQVIVGYGQLADIKNTNGANVTPNVPKFRLQLDLSALESKKDKMNLSKNHDGDELMNFAVIRNKKAKENQSPYIVIVKRQGQPAIVDGKEVKYSDASALMEFTVNMKEMKEKAEKAGVDLKENKIPIAIGSFSGPTGVKINDNSNLVKNKELGKDGYNLTLGKSNAVNQFDRIISTRRNLDTSIKDIRYSNKDMGEGITFSREVQMKNKSNRKEEKEYNMTLTDTFMKLSPKAIKELPEADAFGNIKLAVCTKRTDETYLKQNNLHLDDKKQLVNVEGKRVPDMSIVADPKTYKNGQPYENTVKTFMVRKDDLLRYPKLKDDKGNENAIAIKLDGLTGNVVLNVSQYVKNNQTEDVNNFIRMKTGDKSFSLDDKNKYQAIDATKIDTQTVQYKKDYAIAEVKAWKKTNPGLKPEDFKNAPSQFDIFKVITSELQAKQAKIIKESSKNDQSKDQDQNNDLNQNKGRKI